MRWIKETKIHLKLEDILTIVGDCQCCYCCCTYSNNGEEQLHQTALITLSA